MPTCLSSIDFHFYSHKLFIWSSLCSTFASKKKICERKCSSYCVFQEESMSTSPTVENKESIITYNHQTFCCFHSVHLKTGGWKLTSSSSEPMNSALVYLFVICQQMDSTRRREHGPFSAASK